MPDIKREVNVRIRAPDQDFRTALELAGLEIPSTLGGLELIPAPGIAPVVAELRHGDIWWRFARDEETEGPRPGASSGRELLRAFAAVSSPASAVSFVRRFGPLGLCRAHGLPGHIPCGYWPGWPPFLRRPDEHDADGTEYYVESLDGYLFFARLTRALIRIGSQLKGGPRQKQEDLETVDELSQRLADAGVEKAWPNPKGPPDFWLAWIFNWLGNYASATPRCAPRWTITRDGRLRFAGLDLSFALTTFGTIALQLINTFTQGREIYACSYCGRPYTPRRKPNPNRRNFCDDCRAEGIPERLRSRDLYQRKKARAADHLSAAGVPEP